MFPVTSADWDLWPEVSCVSGYLGLRRPVTLRQVRGLVARVLWVQHWHCGSVVLENIVVEPVRWAFSCVRAFAVCRLCSVFEILYPGKLFWDSSASPIHGKPLGEWLQSSKVVNMSDLSSEFFFSFGGKGGEWVGYHRWLDENWNRLIIKKYTHNTTR